MIDALALGELRDKQEAMHAEGAIEPRVLPPAVSRIEREEDIYLSSLRIYVEELGGRLELTAVFPDQTIVLAPPRAKRRVRSRDKDGDSGRPAAGSAARATAAARASD
jgi:hypothetical protein